MGVVLHLKWKWNVVCMILDLIYSFFHYMCINLTKLNIAYYMCVHFISLKRFIWMVNFYLKWLFINSQSEIYFTLWVFTYCLLQALLQASSDWRWLTVNRGLKKGVVKAARPRTTNTRECPPPPPPPGVSAVLLSARHVYGESMQVRRSLQ